MAARPLTGAWAPLLVLLLAGAAYVNTLGFQFVWDDWPMVVQSRQLHDWQHVGELFRSDFTALTGGDVGGHYYRPALALSLALDLALWGAHPGPLHLTNVLLHLAATFLVYRLALALAGGRDLAVLAGLLFALHPVHVEAIAWVAARGDLLLTVASLGCVLAYRRAALPRRQASLWTLGALAMHVLALLAKESAVALPALLVALDYTIPVAPAGPTAVRPRSAVRRSLPFWALALAFGLFRLPALLELGAGSPSLAALGQRLPGSLEILARYVALSLAPFHPRPFYDLPRPVSLLAPGPLCGLLAAAGAVSLVWLGRRRAGIAAAGAAWFLVTVLPVLDLLPLSFRSMGLADRYLYLPTVGVALGLAQPLAALLAQPARSPRRRAGLAFTALLAALSAGLLLWYQPVWRNEIALFSRMVQDAPDSAAPWINLGIGHLSAGDLPRAAEALERASRLDGGEPRARAILAQVYLLQGREAAARPLLDRPRDEAPGLRDYYVARAMAELDAGERGAALATAREGMARFPAHAVFPELMGRALERSGQPLDAATKYEEALRLNPELYAVEERLGQLAVQAGRPQDAMRHFERALEIRPGRVEAVRALALLSEAGGDRAASLRLWGEVLESGPPAAWVREAVQHIRHLQGESTRLGSAASR